MSTKKIHVIFWCATGISIFTFSYPWMVLNVLFLDEIFEVEIMKDLHVLRPPESENHIFSCWSDMYVCVCYQHNSKTNYRKNFKFDILHLCHIHMILETFYEDRTKTLCTGAHKIIQMH